MTKPFVIFSTLLLLAGSAVAQESKGFSFPDEKEDSLSSLAIMPVKRPKELLMQVAERIELALQQRHGARKYRIKSSYKFDYDSIPPFYASCTIPIESDNGLEVSNVRNFQNVTFEDFRLDMQEGQVLRDTSEIKVMFLIKLEGQIHSSTNQYFNPRGVAYAPWFLGYKDARKRYKIKAYSITDDTGRGVYRIDFVEKKNIRQYWFRSSYYFTGTAYFDMHTLQLTQFKTDYRYTSTHIPPRHFATQYDYEEENGFPVLKEVRTTDIYPHLVIRITGKKVK